MKVVSRLASPAGFGLVLLLFVLMPFLSVSCDVPDAGKTGADYQGTHLVTGDKPDWVIPPELDELLSAPESPSEQVPDPGVQVLAIALVALCAAGVAVGFLPKVMARLYGSAALAAAALAVAVVTMVVALSNLRSALLPQAEGIAASTAGDPQALDAESLVDDALHLELGFWFVAVLLAMILVANAGTVFLTRRAVASGAATPG